MRCIEDLSNSILLRQKKLQSLNKEYYLKEVDKIFSHNELLKRIVSFIGLVDLYSNCAKVSIENVYKRPLLKDKNSFILAKDIRHPIVEKIQTDIPYVPNDISLNEDGILLYGTNACGKSTLMKSIGLSLIMAQAGFFVPCSFVFDKHIGLLPN
jgi:DNA mismatch repair protein MutS